MIVTIAEARALNKRAACAQMYRLNVARVIGTMPESMLRDEAQFDGPFAARMAQHELDRREELDR